VLIATRAALATVAVLAAGGSAGLTLAAEVVRDMTDTRIDRAGATILGRTGSLATTSALQEAIP